MSTETTPSTGPAAPQLAPPAEEEKPANVYVAGLPPTVTEDLLSQIFSAHGTVESVKIMVNELGMSKGAGFVKFPKYEEGAAAVAALNGTNMYGADVQVRFAQPKKNKPVGSTPLTPFGALLAQSVGLGNGYGGGGGYGPMKTQHGNNQHHPYNQTGSSSSSAEGHNVYVSGFPKSWTKENLSAHFASFGEISNCHVMVDKATGEGKGAGFLRFNTFQEASAAIDSAHNTMVEGATARLQVRFAREQKQPDSSQQQNLMMQYQAAALSPFLQTGNQYGAMGVGGMGGIGGQDLSFGDYTQNAGAMNSPYWALQQQQYAALAGLGMGGMGMGGMGATGQEQAVGGESGCCLFVMHIPNDWRDENLRTLFQEYGQTTQVKAIMDNQTGQNKGYGFVNYATMQEAQLACQSLNGYRIGHKYLKVSFKKPKGT